MFRLRRVVTRRPGRAALVVWSLLIPPAAVLAQGTAATPGQETVVAPAAVAVRISEAPRLDGDVLNDPAWAKVPATAEFWQMQPHEGAPASERTEVRVAFTDDTLYFGVICYDRDAAGIITADSRRDSSLDDTDSFQIILDTYRDRQNGFVFGTSPAALEYDGQVSNEGRGSGMFAGGAGTNQQAGSGGGFNLNWDGAWRVRTRVSELGWTAEFAIPFRTLRYPARNPQTWGINFQRNIRRRNEQAFWAPVPRQFNIYRLSLAGTLTGVEARGPRTLTVTPYALGQTVDTRRRASPVTLGDVGADAKFGLTPSLTLDATYNTDFAQVEVDEQQVNLDRFNLFFPEKRPFFLENAGLFSVGTPGELELFFSRQVGISPSGQTIPILGGGRVSGNVGGTSIGVLDMQTDAAPGEPAMNFAVARVLRELPNRTAVGAIVVNREATGDLVRRGDYNRTFAVDGRVGVGANGLFSGFLGRTATPGVRANQAAGKIGYRHELKVITFEGNLTRLGEGFNPEVGFLSRRAYTKADGSVFTRFRPNGRLKLQELRPHTSFRAFWNVDRFQETGYWHIDNHWVFRAAHEVHTGMNLTREGVLRSFAIYPGVTVPAGTYDHQEAQIVALTNQGAPLSARIDTNIGGFFGGSRVSLRPAVRLRSGERFSAELGWQRNDVSLPGGDFVTNLGRLRLSYSFSPRLFVQTLAQFNDVTDTWSANVRAGWLQAANTGLFVVFNDTQATAFTARPSEGRSLVVKYSRLIDLGR